MCLSKITHAFFFFPYTYADTEEKIFFPETLSSNDSEYCKLLFIFLLSIAKGSSQTFWERKITLIKTISHRKQSLYSIINAECLSPKQINIFLDNFIASEDLKYC